MEEKPELSEYVFIGRRGLLIFHAEKYPSYGCIPLVGLSNEHIFTADLKNVYHEEED